MTCGHCCGLEQLFDEKKARRDLNRYYKRGAGSATNTLLKGLNNYLGNEVSLMDIGGGIGAIPLELSKDRLHKVINVDASHGYQKVAREAASKAGLTAKTQFHYGDFIDVHTQLEQADVLTLDKVICCYPDVTALLQAATQRSNQLIGLVYPKDSGLFRLLSQLGNRFIRWRYKGFQTYVHANDRVFSLLEAGGFELSFHKNTLFWQVMVWSKKGNPNQMVLEK